MKQLYKISLIIIILFSFSSCLLDEEEEISSKDLLLGKWQTISYTENDSLPNYLSICDISKTMEFFANNEITFIEYTIEDDTEFNCVFDETYTFNYQIKDDNSFKIFRSNGLVINVEILELTTSTLIIKYVFDGYSIKETFEKIN